VINPFYNLVLFTFIYKQNEKRERMKMKGKRREGVKLFLCPRLTRMTSTILLVVSRTINKDTSERGGSKWIAVVVGNNPL
jgi:hypothetical protein